MHPWAGVHVRMVWRLPRRHGWLDQPGHTGVRKSLVPWILWSRLKHEKRQCCSPAGAAARQICVKPHEPVSSPLPRTIMRDPSPASLNRSWSMGPVELVTSCEWRSTWPSERDERRVAKEVTFKLQGSQRCTHSNKAPSCAEIFFRVKIIIVN